MIDFLIKKPMALVGNVGFLHEEIPVPPAGLPIQKHQKL